MIEELKLLLITLKSLDELKRKNCGSLDECTIEKEQFYLYIKDYYGLHKTYIEKIIRRIVKSGEITEYPDRKYIIRIKLNENTYKLIEDPSKGAKELLDEILESISEVPSLGTQYVKGIVEHTLDKYGISKYMNIKRLTRDICKELRNKRIHCTNGRISPHDYMKIKKHVIEYLNKLVEGSRGNITSFSIRSIERYLERKGIKLSKAILNMILSEILIGYKQFVEDNGYAKPAISEYNSSRRRKWIVNTYTFREYMKKLLKENQEEEELRKYHTKANYTPHPYNL